MPGVTLVGLLISSLISGALSAVTYTISSLLAPKPLEPTVSGTIDRLRSMRRGNTDPGRVGYGTNRTSGILFYAESVDEFGVVKAAGSDFLHVALAVSYGPIEQMFNFVLNDRPLSDTLFRNLVSPLPMLGEDDQQPITGPIQMEREGVGAFEQQSLELPVRWLEKARPVSGIAYLWVILRHHPEIFQSGAPTILIEWKGRRLYDPRLDLSESGGFMDEADSKTWTYSNNWALVIRDFLTSRAYGMKVPGALICDTCIKAAADSADELVDAPLQNDPETPDVTAQEKRYSINGLFETDEQPIDVLSRMLGAGAGALLFFASHADGDLEQYHLRAGVAEAVATWPDDPAIPAESKHIKDLTVANPSGGTIAGEGIDDLVIVGQKVKLTGMTTSANDGFYTVFGTTPNLIVTVETFDTPESTSDVQFEPSLRGMEVELTPDDLRDDSPLQLTPQLNRKDRINRVTGTYINPDADYLPDQFPPVTHPDFKGKDGNLDFTHTVEFPLTQSADMARRLATIALKSGRLGERMVWPGKPRLAVLTPWSVVRVTHPYFGWTKKKFRILDRQIHEDMGVDKILSEYSDDLYIADIDPAALPRPTDLPPTFSVRPPRAVNLTSESITLPDGSRQMVIVVAITPPNTGTVAGYRIRYQFEDEGWSTANVTDPYFVIPGVRLGLYRVAVATHGGGGIFSTEVLDNLLVTLNQLPPPNPVDFKVVRKTDDSMELAWDLLPTPPDLSRFAVRSLAGANGIDLDAEWLAATPLAEVSGFSHILGQPTEETRTYYVKAIDTSGNESVLPAFLVYAHEIVDTSLVSVRNWKLEGWPGHIASGRVNGAGELEGASSVQTWAGPATWAEFLQWGEASAGPLHYTTPILDLAGDPTGHNILASLDATWTERNTSGAIVTWRGRRNEDETWGAWQPENQTIEARFFQIRVTMQQSSEAVGPVLETFSTKIGTALQAHHINDYGGRFSGVSTFRVESGEGFKIGDQVKVAVGADGSLQPDFTPGMRLGGSDYIGNNFVNTYDAMREDYTVEFGFRFPQAPTGFDNNFLEFLPGALEDAWIYIGISGSDATLTWDAVGWTKNVSVKIFNADTDFTTWHNIAFRYTGGNILEALYDGEVVDFQINAAQLPTLDNHYIQLGGGASVKSAPRMLFDYFRLWNIARSDDAIKSNAHIRLTDEPGLIFSTNFEDGLIDPSGEDIRDLTPYGNHMSTGGGTPLWLRSGNRESPPVSLNVPGLSGVGVQWEGAEPNNSVVFVEASTDSGETWTEIPTSGESVGLALPPDPTAHTLRIRSYLESGDALNDTPYISRIITAMGIQRTDDGFLPIPVTKPFADVRTAQIVAMQGVDAGLGIQPPELISKSQLVAVFRLRDMNGNPIAVANSPELVDVLVQGVLLP